MSSAHATASVERPALAKLALPLGTLAFGVAAFLILSSLREPEARQETVVPPPRVEVETVQAHEGGLDLNVDGLVVPYREITIAAETAGRVARKSSQLRAGRFIHKLDAEGRPNVLVEIDDRDYQLDVRRLTAEVEQAKASLAELAVESTNTKEMTDLASQVVALHERELERLRNLARSRAATESEIDVAARNLLAARDSLLKLNNQFEMMKSREMRLMQARENAKAMLEKAQLDLERTKITAPIDGMVVADLVEEDSYVQKGTAIATIEDTSAVEVRCSLRTDDLHWLWRQAPQAKGDPYEVGASVDRATSYEIPRASATVVYRLGSLKYAWQGELSRYDGIGLDEKTRTVPCRVIVRKPTEGRLIGDESASQIAGPPALVRGMYVTIHIHAQPNARLLEISERALRPGNVVWAVRQGKLNIVHVRTVRSTAGRVLIDAQRSKLSPGEKIVSSPLSGVVDRMEVRLPQAAPREQAKP